MELLTLNTQPVEKRVTDKSAPLEVFKVWRTIQGEGPLFGRPAVFVRLAGCILQCPVCDTDYTGNRSFYGTAADPDGLVADILQHRGRANLVVLTGGEPLRQPLSPLIHRLLRHGLEVQIETSGVLFDPDIPWEGVVTVVSPKAAKVHPDLMPHVDALKYVVQAGQVDPADGLPTSALGLPVRPARPWKGFDPPEVFVQPADVKDEAANRANLEAAVASCLAFGYRLGVQAHKLAGLE